MAAILKIKNKTTGEWEEIPALVGTPGKDGKDGKSGVYVGSGEMPEDCNVQIDEDGEPLDVVLTVNGVKPDEDGNVSISVGGNSVETERVEILESVVTLEPNKYYVFPEMTSLEVQLGGTVDASIVQEYTFRFTSGATATTLTLSEEVKGEIKIEANKIYEISIVDNLLLSQCWAVSE